PMAWHAMLDRDTSQLPFLGAAILRHLQQFPSFTNGLNRTEQQILTIVKQGEQIPGKIFAENQVLDQVIFMGDSTFWRYIEGLMQGEVPLLLVTGQEAFEIPECYPYPESFTKQRLSLTTMGEAVLRGDADWLDLHPLDRWYGGVHLQSDSHWRWDESNRIVDLFITE
ncbi:MAG: RNA polymerase subunit sigma, partial [Gammaproteobacteria bacterium]